MVLESSTLYEMGIITFRYLRDRQRAKELFLGSYEISEALQLEKDQIQSLCFMNLIKNEEGDADGAERGFRECVQRAMLVGDIESLAFAFLGRARSRRSLGMNSEAKSDLGAAKDLALLLKRADLIDEIETLGLFDWFSHPLIIVGATVFLLILVLGALGVALFVFI